MVMLNFTKKKYLGIFENTTRERNLSSAPRELTVPPPSRTVVILVAVYSATIKLQRNHLCASNHRGVPRRADDF